MSACVHLFEKDRSKPRWKQGLRRKYVCVHCSMETRHYDAADQWAGRPIYDGMSVAVIGFNVKRRRAKDS